MIGSLRCLLCAGILLSALGGCDDIKNLSNMKNTPYGETFRWQAEYGWTEQTILRHGWTDSNVRDLPPDPPVYCYRTIGQTDCFRSPRPAQGRRLMGYFGSPPL